MKKDKKKAGNISIGKIEIIREGILFYWVN